MFPSKKNIFLASTILLFLLLNPIYTAQAQNKNRIDSLLKILPTQNDSLKVKTLIELRIAYSGHDFSKALDYAQEALELSQQIGFKRGIAISLDGLGSLYERQGDFPKGLDYKLEALKIQESLGNKPGIAKSCNNIGVLYYKNNQFKDALEYYMKALKIVRELNDEASIAIYLLNIGEVYHDLKEYNKAIQFENASLEISKRLGVKDNIAFANGIIGKVYASQMKYKEALEYEHRALNLFKELDDKIGVCEYLLDIARIFLTTNRLDSAMIYTEEAYRLSIQADDVKKRRDALFIKSEIYEKQNDFKEALHYKKKYLQLQDSILNESGQEKIARMQALYGSEKKQIEIEALKKEKERQFTFIIALIILFLTCTGFIVFLIRNNRQKQVAYRLLSFKNKEINEQKGEIERQHEILNEQKKEIELQSIELKRKNEDITASITYAKRIQEAVAPKLADIQETFREHFIFFKPRDIVSGDFYWFSVFEKEGKNKILLAVVDCTGHGVPGAFMSMIGSNLLNKIVNEKEITAPDLVLNELHKEIRLALHQDTSKSSDGMDISMILMDHPDEILPGQDIIIEFAAANSSLIYFDEQSAIGENQNTSLEIITLKGDKMPIGGEHRDKNKLFTKHTIRIDMQGKYKRRNMFYLFTDGFQDQFGGARNKKFGLLNFRKMLYTIQGFPMEQQMLYLENTLQEWMECCDEKQIDDILIIGFRI